MYRSLAAVLLALALVPSASAQTIVNTGDDLAAIVAAAASGDVIQIDSDATFVGTLVLAGKTLTVEAGPGFSPTVKGSTDGASVLIVASQPASDATLRGLQLASGDPSSGLPPPPGLAVVSVGTVADSLDLVLEDCTLSGKLRTSGNGDAACSLTVKDSLLLDDLNFFGTQTTPIAVELVDCEVAGALIVSCTSSFGAPLHMLLSLERTVFGATLALNAASGGSLTATSDSCIVDGTSAGLGIGVRVLGDAVSQFTNTTVTGWWFGIEGTTGASWDNLLLFDNDTDLSNVLPGQIEHSLIEDGTYAGLDGNFSGQVLVDADLALLACSAGLDGGSNAAPGLGPTDVYGNPRIQDNDGDLTATVNVGAVEVTGSTPGSAVVFNGTDQNPVEYVAATLPAIGQTFQAFVNPAAGTFQTVLVLDNQAGPFVDPAWTGELLLALSGTAFYDFALGPHALSVPLDCNLVGLTVASQAFRLDNVLGVVSIHCLNGLDLTIGG